MKARQGLVVGLTIAFLTSVPMIPVAAWVAEKVGRLEAWPVLWVIGEAAILFLSPLVIGFWRRKTPPK